MTLVYSLQERLILFVYGLFERHRLVLLRTFIVCAVLASGVLAGRLIVRGSPDPYILIAAPLVAGIFVYNLGRLGHFEYGIVAMLLSAGLLNVVTLPTGTESRIVISLLIAIGLTGLWILQWLIVDKRIVLKPSPLNLPLFIYIAVNVIAYLWSLVLRDPLLFIWASFPVVQLAALVVNILLPFLALLVSNKINEVKWLKWLMVSMIGMGIIANLSFQLNLPTIAFVSNGARGLFATWVGGTALALLLFHRTLPNWQRLGLVLLLIALFYRNAIVNTAWLSGWMPLTVASIVVIFMRSKRLFLLLIVAFAIQVMLNFDVYYERVYVANVNEGSDSRLGLWDKNLEHVRNHPLFGMGPAGYAIYNMTYHPWDARSTHNNYFDILAQNGIVGILTFAWLMGTLLWLAYKTARRLSGRGDFAEAYANAALAGGVGALLAMMLGDWVLPFAYNQTITGFDNALYTWVFLGGLVSLYRITATTQESEPVTASQRAADASLERALVRLP